MSDDLNIAGDEGAGGASGATGLATSVYQRLRKDILSGRQSPNERLKVSTLARQYGTSTNPVREALQQLRGEGLVVIEPNRGARVRTIDADFVRDIYEMEVLLEPHLTRWFVGQCTRDDLQRLESLQAQMEKLNFVDLNLHGQLDTEFHQLMYHRNYNRHAVGLWWKHREILRAINPGQGVSLRRQSDIMSEHRELLAAIRANDEERAAQVIRRHVQGSGKHIVEQMRICQPEMAS